MKNYGFITFLFFCLVFAKAQVNDSFSDGNFTSSPSWSGSTSQFVINDSQQLQLSAGNAGSSYLSTPFTVTSLDNFEWQIFLKQSFSPSGSNYSRVYLSSDQSDLTQPLNGYYLQFGEAGANDAVELFRQAGSTSSSICRATNGGIASSFAIRIKVLRNITGLWKIFVDYAGGTNFVAGPEASDSTYTSALFMGVLCVYTVSNDTKFYYDDFYAGPEQLDTTPPGIQSFEVVSSSQLSLHFTEVLDTASAKLVSNYSADHNLGQPQRAFLENDKKSVTLSFSNPFVNGEQNHLDVSGVRDSAGNTMIEAQVPFLFFQPVPSVPGDLLITEIFPDPLPPVGLPEAEYIELYNRSDNPVDLAGWILSDATSSATFTSQIIFPEEYWIITSAISASDFAPAGHVIGLINFPSLNNSGDLLLLKSSTGKTIDSLNYSQAFYHDTEKQQGGWSLKLVDLNGSASDSLNWVASMDPAGGTPGRQNSWFGKNPDNKPPQLEQVVVKGESELMLIFNEALDPRLSFGTANFSVTNGIGAPTSVLQGHNPRSIDLHFLSRFKNGTKNFLTVNGVVDLAGNKMLPATTYFTFLIPVLPKRKDIIITEIFPDPIPQVGLPTAEYVEIFNRSTSPFDLLGWKFSDGTSTGILSSTVILPQQYWILTSSSSASQFVSWANTMFTTNFPTLNNDGDALTLSSPDGATVDSVNYSITWYREPDKEEGGWSLELIDPANPCGEEENWTASEDPKGGTPGRQNSVFANKPDLTGPSFLAVVPLTPMKLLLTFDETLDPAAPSTGTFTLSPFTAISESHFNDLSLRQIQLTLTSPLLPRQRYSLSVLNVYDCNQNPIREEFSRLDFALPEPADSLDVVVNEILFNPRPNGVDFVEVFNRSQKYINLSDWKLANIEGDELKDPHLIANNNVTLGPNSYLAFTSDPLVLKNNYPQGKEENFFQMPLPGLPNDAGSIALVNDQGKVIDYFLYNKDLHSPLIKDDEGVSLERISFSNSTNDNSNWKSASAQSGFATPGYVNSNARPDPSVEQGTVRVEPQVFIPNSGTPDFAKISYAFEQAGYLANVKILDQQGRLIKSIANNDPIGFEGFFQWDGDRDDGSQARMGYYTVWLEVFDTSGSVRTFRKRVVIAGR